MKKVDSDDKDDKESDEDEEEEEDDDGLVDAEAAVKIEQQDDEELQDKEQEESNKASSAATAAAACRRRRRTKTTQGRPRKRRATTTTTTTTTSSKLPTIQQQQADDDDEQTAAQADESTSLQVCPHCQKNFSSVHGLNYHVQKLVCQPKPCPGCQQSFPTLVALRQHQNSGDCTGNTCTANGNDSEPDDNSQQQQQQQQEHDNNDISAVAASSSPISTGRTLRRSSPRQNRARINYTLDTNDDTDDEEEDDDEEEEGDEEKEEVVALDQADEKEADELSDDAGDYDDDDDDSDFSERPKKRFKKSTTTTTSPKKKESTKNNKTSAATATDFSCQYCSRKFKGIPGLRYHIDQFVCRPNERPGGPVRKGKRKMVTSSADATTTATTTATGDADVTATSGSNSKFKRIRGSLNARTCGMCSRVFTSILGLQYHIEKRVCQQVKQDAAVAFPTLQPGMKFDTPYGVVQVVRDDSASPTARLRSDLRNSARHYTNAKIKHEIKIARNIQSVAVTHLARRKRLRHLYERSIMTAGQADLMNQANVFACYFGKDPRLIPRKEHVAQPTAGPLKTVDPCAPEGSFPDRIVECILVEDKRDRYSSLEEHAMRASKKRPSQDNDNEQRVGTDTFSSAVKPTRLYLRRRMLTEPYSETTDLLTCQDCGTVFTSRPGCTYHVNSKVCFQKIDTGKEETRERIELMDKRAIAYLLQREKHVAKGLEERVMPIDFILSLTSDQGMVAESTLEAGTVAESTVAAAAAAAVVGNSTTGSVALTASKMKPAPANPVQKLDKTIVGDPNFKDPRLILAELKAQLRYQQSVLCGPMYPSVFKALGYKKPRKPPNKKRPRPKPKPPAALTRPPPPQPARRQPVVSLPLKSSPPQNEQVASLKKSPVHPQQDNCLEKKNKMQPPPSATNGRFAEIVKGAMPPRRKRDRKALPIFDTRPLAAEVRAGRYPTVKARGYDDPLHSPNCALCKKAVRDKKGNPQRDPLLPCDFCEKQVHLSCMLTKLIIKEPEPGEDFMCYYCINCLCSRRARAERRRLEKLTKETSSASSSTVPVLDVTSTLVITQHRFATDPSIVPVKDLVSFTDQVVEGREYDCVVAQGRRLHDLVELTRDSQKRLAQHAETARMNAARRQMLDL